ncbi:MAG: hypothetical protein U0574_02540 [Phycisphaerales bacterium]
MAHALDSSNHGTPLPDASGSRTNWDELEWAGNPDATRHDASREAVAIRYWPMVYAFIRHSGRSHDESAELTQAFLAEVFYGRGLLQVASPARGRFRSLLMHAVGNFLRDDARRRFARSRAPSTPLLPLSGDEPAVRCVEDRTDPRVAFSAAWVAVLLRDAAEALRRELEASGRQEAWRLFEVRVLRPALSGGPTPSLEQSMIEAGAASRGQASHWLACAKRRFATLVMNAAGVTSGEPDRCRDELADLLSLLRGHTTEGRNE